MFESHYYPVLFCSTFLLEYCVQDFTNRVSLESLVSLLASHSTTGNQKKGLAELEKSFYCCL